MFPRINEVRYIKEYLLELAFADGTAAKLDFRERIVGRGGVFSALAGCRKSLEFEKFCR